LPEIAGEAALLVDPLSIEHMAEGLELLWKDADLRQELVEKGRIQRELFSWDKAALSLFNLLGKKAQS
jgi:glycosyltransferase involved in cell wall biosynthesis